MKKVRFMLTAIGILAAVGGTLAFKAMRVNVCYYERLNNPGICNVVTADIFSTGAPEPFGNRYNTTLVKAGANCPAANLVNCLQKHQRIEE